MSAHTQAKSTRLLSEGRVRPSVYNAEFGPQAFDVDGDTGGYKTVVGVGLSMCSCEGWRIGMRECSHIAAARKYVIATPEERALIDEVLALRAERDRVAGEAAFDRL